MSEIAKTVGQHIRNDRTQLGYSQKKLAELSDCHPTYIGQLERGEKNATLESLEKISKALGVSLLKLFEMMGGAEDNFILLVVVFHAQSVNCYKYRLKT